MEEKQSPLEQPFGQIRFVVKSAVVFLGILGLAALLKDFSKPIDEARLLIFSVRWGLPLLFMAFLPLHLVYELIWISHRNRMEKLRKPGRNRAAIGAGGRARRRPNGR